MTPIQAIILGLIQGITEFLPVSSSGHLEIGKHLFGLNMTGSESLTFDVVVHAGTALSTVVVFRKDIGRIIAGLLEFRWNDETKFASYIIISMIPAAFIGLAFEDQITALFEGQLLLVGAMLVLTGIFIVFSGPGERNDEVGVRTGRIRDRIGTSHCDPSWGEPFRGDHQYFGTAWSGPSQGGALFIPDGVANYFGQNLVGYQGYHCRSGCWRGSGCDHVAFRFSGSVY